MEVDMEFMDENFSSLKNDTKDFITKCLTIEADKRWNANKL